MRPSLFKVGDHVTVDRAYRKGGPVESVEHCACDVCFATDRYTHPLNAVVVKVWKVRPIDPRYPGNRPINRYSLKIEGQPGVWWADGHQMEHRNLIEMIGELDDQAPSAPISSMIVAGSISSDVSSMLAPSSVRTSRRSFPSMRTTVASLRLCLANQ